MISKHLVAVVPLFALAIASPLQKRSNVDLFVWGSANLQDYDTYYSFPADSCQAIATPSTGRVGSVTVDLNASCDVYASSDCTGSVAGSFSAPGVSDTGSLGDSFGSVQCSVPSSVSATAAQGIDLSGLLSAE